MSNTPASTMTASDKASTSGNKATNGNKATKGNKANKATSIKSNKVTAGIVSGSVAVSITNNSGGSGSGKDSGSANGAASASNGSSGASASASLNSSIATTGGAGAAGRFRMETNFYVLAIACLLLANKSLRARVGSARPHKRDDLLRAAYGVQFRGRVVEKGTRDKKWESKLAAAELEVLITLGFDVHVTDPLEALDQQRVQKFISAACHSKASSLVVESVTQGCSAWLRFEPDAVALAILLLAIGTTASRDELMTRAQTLAVNAGITWPAVLACTQSLVRSLPSLVGEKGGSEGLAAALRQVPAADPRQYPDYEPPLMAAQKRLRQRRRAEDGVFDADLRTADLLMMRKAQDRAGLHGDLGGLQGMEGMAGFGSTLASNKFVRAAIRQEVLVSAGLECMVPYLEPWKGFTVAGPLAGVDGGKILEVYLQRWPTDKKEGDSGGCGLSSSGMSELALFQELHSYSAINTGHDTLLVPLAVVMGTAMKTSGKSGASGFSSKVPPNERIGGGSKPDGKSRDAITAEERASKAIGLGIDPLPPLMNLGSNVADMNSSLAAVGAETMGGNGNGERSDASQIPDELLRPSYLLLEPVRYTLAEILRLCRRPMVLPGPLVKSMLQDLLGAVALCHDRNIVIKAIDAEKVYLDQSGRLKLGCLAQAMMVSAKDKDALPPSASTNDINETNGTDELEPDVNLQEDGTMHKPGGQKSAHRQGKHAKQKAKADAKANAKLEKHARDTASKKAVAAMVKEGEPSKTVLWAMAPEVIVDQKYPHGPGTDIWAVGCLAAQLALGKPIFGGRTRKQQLEYVFKCCGSPGQGRWPEGNKAPLYRHLRPVDTAGKSQHFKPRLDKVLAAEGHKGVPLDPGLTMLLQGLLKLDARHRLSAREALASPYFAPVAGLREEINDAWLNLRGDLDKVQMGVATPDQLRGTYAAANAPTVPPPPPPPAFRNHDHDRDHFPPSPGGLEDLPEELIAEGETMHGEMGGIMNLQYDPGHGSVHLPLEHDVAMETLQPVLEPVPVLDSVSGVARGTLVEDRERPAEIETTRSLSPQNKDRTGRTPDNGIDNDLRERDHRQRDVDVDMDMDMDMDMDIDTKREREMEDWSGLRDRDLGRDRDRDDNRNLDRERERLKAKRRKRERDRQRYRDRGRDRDRERDRDRNKDRDRDREREDARLRDRDRDRDRDRRGERSGMKSWRNDKNEGRERWGSRGGRV